MRRAQAILDLDDACCAEFLEAFEREGLQFEVARACHERGDPAPEGTFYGPPEGWPGAMDPPRLAP